MPWQWEGSQDDGFGLKHMSVYFSKTFNLRPVEAMVKDPDMWTYLYSNQVELHQGLAVISIQE